jgi:hypothetical protein
MTYNGFLIFVSALMFVLVYSTLFIAKCFILTRAWPYL